jgi:O-antigen ligase
MDRERIDGWCEKGILGLVLGILVFAPLALGGRGPVAFLVIQGMTTGVIALWALRLWVGDKPQFLWPPVCWAVLAFMVYAIGRYLEADIEYVARREMIRVLVYGFLFFAILNNCHRQEFTQIIVLTLVFLGMAVAFYACCQYFSKSQRVWNIPSSYPGRASGTFIYPNHLAGYLEMLFPLGLCCVLMGRFGHVTKVILAYASVVMLAAIGVTISRGGWLVAGVELLALCGVLVAQRDYRIQGGVLLAGCLLAGALLYPKMESMHTRLQQAVSSGHADDLRFAIWQPAWHIWREHLWWGAGPAHFDYRFPQYRPVSVQMDPEYVHNDYLNTLVDWGLAGALLIASAWVLLYWGVGESWRTVRGGRDDFARKKSSKFALLVGASLGLAGILLHSFFDFNLHSPAIAILAVTLMALLSSQWRFATERFWFRAGTGLKCLVTAILLSGIGYLGYEGCRAARENNWQRIANAMNPVVNHFSHVKIAALEQAAEIEPMNPKTPFEIGECYWEKSLDGGDDYVALAKKAINWYSVAMKLNPYDAINWLNTGRCLDWIGSEAGAGGEDSFRYYQRANELDQNNYFVSDQTGWHYVQTGDLAAARSWFERSMRLEPVEKENKIAYEYLPIIDRRLREAADEHK